MHVLFLHYKYEVRSLHNKFLTIMCVKETYHIFRTFTASKLVMFGHRTYNTLYQKTLEKSFLIKKIRNMQMKDEIIT